MFWKRNKEPLMFAEISESDAKISPYLIVFVEKDGTVRELHDNEKKYLETPFYPSDGARPYIKKSYSSKNGWGDISGYCYRSKILSNIHINPPPTEDPTNTTLEEFIQQQTKFAEDNGFEVIHEDGKIIMSRKNQK